MFKKILACVDGSEQAKRAVGMAAELASTLGAELILLHVLGSVGSQAVPEELEAFERIEHMRMTERDLIESVGRDLLAEAQVSARKHGIAEATMLMEVGDPARIIVETAEKSGVDLIVLGRRGLGDLKGLLLGSVSHKVAQAATCSCLTIA